MVARAGGYYGETFYGERVVTQGNPLLPTIFNVVVETVVRHWESLAAEIYEDERSDNDTSHPASRTIRARANG